MKDMVHVFAAEITDQYYNKKEKIEPYLFLIENVKTCMKKLDIEPHIQPIRGGTDGARLSFMGIPCPKSRGAGGHNFHGRYEYCLWKISRSFLYCWHKNRNLEPKAPQADLKRICLLFFICRVLAYEMHKKMSKT